jgi:acetyl-CoA carboxylase biotin carboxyl carrier protein
MMTLDDIRQILHMVREHELAEFEFEQEGVRLRIRKDGGVQIATLPVAAPAAVLPASAPAQPSPAPALAAPAGPGPADALEFAVVKSPIVGTFYRASDPSAPPFAEVGQIVSKGQTLCIIEAMKLMNEITSDYDGEVVKVFVDNGQPVQFGERLFAIKAR